MKTVWVVEFCQHCDPTGHQWGCETGAIFTTEAAARAFIARYEDEYREDNSGSCFRVLDYDVLTELAGG